MSGTEIVRLQETAFRLLLQLYLGADGQWHVSPTTTAEGALCAPEAAPEQPIQKPFMQFRVLAIMTQNSKWENLGLLVAGRYDAITAAKSGLTNFR
ncbi:MAG: hypothetical protein R3B47_19045 [Bacteroidia bacterium]